MKDHAAKCVQKTRRAAALLAGVMALALLAGCAGSESQPVVTDDDLTPGSAVQAAFDLDAGNGKTYSYFLTEQNDLSVLSWEEAEANTRRLQEAAIRDMQDVIAEVEANGAESAEELEKLKSYLNELQSDASLEETLAQTRKAWEAQQGLDPVVTPQEAANRAGWMFEEAYGVNLTGKELMLTCERVGKSPTDSTGRVIWEVWVDLNGNIYCWIDGTTGEFINAGYAEILTQEENERMRQSPLPGCYVPSSPDDPMGHWDPAAPSYQQTIEKIMATVQSAISGSPLVAGAAVTDLEAVLVRENTAIELHLTCDNGKTYTVTPTNAYIEYDYSGYPLRGYAFGNTAYEDLVS